MPAQASDSLDHRSMYSYLACVALVVACVFGVYICKKPRSSRNQSNINLREVKIDKTINRNEIAHPNSDRLTDTTRLDRQSTQPPIGPRNSSLYYPTLQPLRLAAGQDTEKLSKIFSESELQSIQKYLPKEETDYMLVLDAYIHDYFVTDESQLGKSPSEIIKPVPVKLPQKVLFQCNISEDTPAFW
ncbi:hypothetical protein HDV01_005113 [Terramyces sp. JEL0728]|nr:hypothetical protein HDV01_005113 [Terramyces sp. JEL0728]